MTYFFMVLGGIILFAGSCTTSSPFDLSSDGFVFTSAESLITGTASVAVFGVLALVLSFGTATAEGLVVPFFVVVELTTFRLSLALE